MPIQTILLGVVPPVVASLVVLLIAWRPWRAQVPVTRLGIGGSALALALAYALTDTLVTRSSPGFPPADLHRWLPWLGALACVGVIAFPPTGQWRWSPHDLIAIVCFAIMRWEQLRSGEFLYAGLWIAMCTMLAGTMRTDAIRVGSCGPRVPLVWLVAATGASFAYLQSSFDMLAQFAGSLAAVMGIFTLLAFWKPKLDLVPGMAPVFAVLLVAMTQAGSSYVSVETKILLLLAGASHALAGIAPLARAPRWIGTVLSMLLAAAFSVAAIYYSPNGFNFGGY